MRIRILERLILAGLLIVWAGLFAAQVVHGGRFRDKSERNRSRLIHLPAPRGNILDRNGIPLVEDRMRFELAILPQELRDSDDAWRQLSKRVGLPAEELAGRYRRGFVARFSPVTLVRDLPRETAFLLEEERARLPGLVIRPVPQRHYPLGAAVGPVVGYLGLIGPEELTRLRPYGYTFRDWVGKEGVEKTCDPFLRGRDGGLHVEVNAQGRMVQQIGFLAPQRGRSVRLSIDVRLQKLCYDLLRGGEGALIAMEASTGEILSLVSTPSFDPNDFVDPSGGDEIRRVLRHPDQPMFNRATRSRIPPGSVFKPAVAYEALRQQKISAGTAFECLGEYKLGTASFRCWREEGHQAQTVSEALQHSCNIFFYQTGRRLGADGIARAARLFRLDQPTGIDLPGEARGQVPDPAWMKQTLNHTWQEGDTVSFAIGQGPLLVTPLEMLLLFNTIATEGQLLKPRVLLEVDGKAPQAPAAEERVALDRSVLRWVKEGLDRVVNTESGTGRLAVVPGVRVAGKTGTAQVPQGNPHAWFCGYAPADHPKVSFVIFLEHGGKGGLRPAQVAGQLVGLLKEMDYL